MFSELKHEIGIWGRTCNRIMVASEEERMVKELLEQKISVLKSLLKDKQKEQKQDGAKFLKLSIQEMERKVKYHRFILNCT